MGIQHSYVVLHDWQQSLESDWSIWYIQEPPIMESNPMKHLYSANSRWLLIIEYEK